MLPGGKTPNNPPIMHLLSPTVPLPGERVRPVRRAVLLRHEVCQLPGRVLPQGRREVSLPTGNLRPLSMRGTARQPAQAPARRPAGRARTDDAILNEPNATYSI